MVSLKCLLLAVILQRLPSSGGALNRQHKPMRIMMRVLPSETNYWIPEDPGAERPDCAVKERWCKIPQQEWDKALLVLQSVTIDQKEQAYPKFLLDSYYKVSEDDTGWWLKAKWETIQHDFYHARIFFLWGSEDARIDILAPITDNGCAEECIKENGCNFCRGRFHCDCVPEIDCARCFKEQGCYSPDRSSNEPCFNHTAPYIGGAFRVLVRDGFLEPSKWTAGYVFGKDLSWNQDLGTKQFEIHDGQDDGGHTFKRKYVTTDPMKVVCPLRDPVVLKQGN